MAARKKKTTTRKKAATATAQSAVKQAARKTTGGTPVATAKKSSSDRARLMKEMMARTKEINKTNSTNFLKLTTGKQLLKLIPDTASNLLYLRYRCHNGVGEEGRFQEAVDLQWAQNNGDVWEGLLEAGAVTEADSDLVSAYGDPAGRMLQEGKTQALEEKVYQKAFGRTRVLWNVIKDGEAGLLTTGASIVNGLDSELEDWVEEGNDPADVIGADTAFTIQITGRGEKLARRYKLKIVPGDPAEYKGQPYNLIERLSRKVLTYEQKVAFALRSYAQLATKLGMTEKDFGI